MTEIPKPKMRPLTIEPEPGLPSVLRMEALTREAEEWIQSHAPEFGDVSKSSMNSRRWNLFVFRGYEPAQVAAYLTSLWDAQEWPEEV